MNNFNGYGLFHDIKNPTLRTYNRVNAYLNIRDRHGKVSARHYLKRLHRNAQIEVAKMMVQVTLTGFEQFRRDYIRSRKMMVQVTLTGFEQFRRDYIRSRNA